MNPPPHFIFSALHLLFIFLTSSSASQPELRSLLEFKKGITSDPTNLVLNSWSPYSITDFDKCPPKWEGISCDELTGNVTGIVLDNHNLTGEIKFHTLLDLKMLRNLSLAGNQFTGRLPPSLGIITSLQHLDLSSNRFYGPIPARINDLWGLNYLNLSNNEFKGGFPTGLNNLQQLRVLDLHSNELWADIGDLLPTLRNLEFLDLSQNQFYGGLSITLENVSSLANTVRFLNISHNKLNGNFFLNDSIALFRDLQALDLSDNMIRGELPSFVSLHGLRVLRLARNLFFGAVPEDLLLTSMSLEELNLSSNGFTGSIAVINSTTLNILDFSSNSLSEPLPTSLRSCTIMDLSRNMFSGDISVIEKRERYTLDPLAFASTPPWLSFKAKLQRHDTRGIDVVFVDLSAVDNPFCI